MKLGGGALTDLATQRWVMLTGRRADLDSADWLEGPVGEPDGIGGDFFDRWAAEQGLVVDRSAERRGLLPDLDVLGGPGFDPRRVDPDVRRFYEQTSAFELEAWSEWCGPFRPFGWALARIFSRRLQQLNVPLRPLDTSRGTDSEVLHLRRAGGEPVEFAAWTRRLRGSGDVLYAGGYSTARVPGHRNPCVRVVFPLPNGNAIVLLKPSVDAAGALCLLSAGDWYGDPGFYFTVHRAGGRVWARYVRAMRESIRVYGAGGGEVRADHVMWLFGLVFLRLHYRLRPTAG